MNTQAKTTATAGLYRPTLTFYHPNAKGTGCAAQWELHPAHDRTEGSIMLKVANQMTVGNRLGPNPTFPRFDWENLICVKLAFNDLCQILQVLRGECESIEGGRGLYHRTAKATTKIVFRHMIEPTAGYSLEIYRTPAAGGEETRAHLLFSSVEALGLCESIAGSLYLVSFGIPMLTPSGAGETENREMRDATAA